MLEPYLGRVNEARPSILWCPSDRSTRFERTSYGYSMSFYHSPEQINTIKSPGETWSASDITEKPEYVLPSIGQKTDRVRWPARKALAGDWASNHFPIDSEPGWWGWAGRRNFLFPDGHCAWIDANDILPANDGRPDVNLTIDGIKGYDVTK